MKAGHGGGERSTWFTSGMKLGVDFPSEIKLSPSIRALTASFFAKGEASWQAPLDLTWLIQPCILLTLSPRRPRIIHNTTAATEHRLRGFRIVFSTDVF